MTSKSFELRDAGTLITVIALRLDPVDDRDRWLLARAGYGRTPEAQRKYIVLLPMNDLGKTTYDTYGFGPARTYPVAHRWLTDNDGENFERAENGSVIDVEYILGERATPKVTEQRREEPR